MKVLGLLGGNYSEAEVYSQITSFDNADQCRQVFKALNERNMIEKIDPIPLEFKNYDSTKLESLNKHFRRTVSRYSDTGTNSWQPVLAMHASCILLYGAAELVIPLALNLASVAAGRILVLADPVAQCDIARSRHLSAADLGRHPAEVIARQLDGAGLPTAVTAVGAAPSSVIEWQQLLRECDLVISACSKPVIFNPAYESLNKAVLAANVMWLPLAVVDNTEIQMGPAIIPSETACYKCYEYRFQSNVGHVDSYKAFADTVNAMKEVENFGVLPPFAEIAANYATVEAVRMLAPDMTPICAGKLLTVNVEDLSSERHPVLRVPRCPHCNAHAERVPERVWA
ncbi:TOMM precursor leader peptide-binding protein [Herbaspirillum sp. SJZ107]|uniref:TOMM precursor leader peptide-binding protein n=1 Tax=Herbaspirillum sp. SJZ107 TaxID=2572881 RepID=UPI0011704238|nr:TOMM precursor leader peptide-binding protein [Herbaspirillum sp. SJZ107]TQK03382.1 bacteriocin biosynthesis cyclodehydratase domain-containing protein [Herbaspirillum sp. SJZ107]